MSSRGSGGRCQENTRSGYHHSDLRNLSTVQLGETLSSLYLTEQRIPPRQGESSRQRSDNNPRRGSTTPTGTVTNTNININAIDNEDEDEAEEILVSQSRSRSRRRRETSNTSMENNLDDSSTTSMTPSTPPTISSGRSYSGEMNDELTPLREALPPSVSTKRRPITADNGTGNRRNVNASSSYAALPPTRLPLPPPPRSFDMHSPNPNAGLSEILASPTFREMQARSPDYSSSPYERPRRGSGGGSAGGSKPATPKEMGSGAGPVDYFTLPILRDRELDRELEREHDREQEGVAWIQRNPSYSSTSKSSSTNEPKLGLGINHEGTSTSTPSWSSEDVTSTRSSSLRSPRIRNEGFLAPHGSFTSDSGRQYQARARLQRAQTQMQKEHDLELESVKSTESVSSWRSRAGSERALDGSGRRQYSEKEYLENVQAARGGDQLALYHLGWGQTSSNQRHTLGDADLVWGGREEPGSPAPSSRSSNTSRPSVRTNSTSGSFPRHLSTGKSHEETLRDALSRDGIPAPRRASHTRSNSTGGTDLFADVAQMTLQSNAKENRAQASAQTQARPQTPQEKGPSATTAPPSPRPSLFKSASYVSSSTLKTSSGKKEKETSEQRKERKLREEGIEKDREKDPEKEKEREKRRIERRAARTVKPASGGKGGDESNSGSNGTGTTKK